MNNGQRVKLAQKSLAPYAELNDEIVCKENVIDCLANLRHYCDRHGYSFAELDRVAYGHYVVEKPKKLLKHKTKSAG